MVWHHVISLVLVATPDGNDSTQARIDALETEVARLQLLVAETPEPTPAPALSSPTLFNPTLTVISNGLYRYDDLAVGEEARIDKAFNLREVELDLRAAVDPFADAVFIAALESEVPGEFEAAIEESYVIIKRLPLPLFDEPPLGLKLKVGRFLTDLGRVNRTHLHDLPHTSLPLVNEEFLGEEGHHGNGISGQVFLPSFDDAAALELTVQALTGGGLAIADGPIQRASLIGNLRWFRTFGGSHNVDLSLIGHYGHTGPRSTQVAKTGSVDLLYKWKPLRGGEFNSLVLGGQVFYTERTFPVVDDDGVAAGNASTSPLGYFAFLQGQLARPLYLGLRYDDTQTIADDTLRRQAASTYLTYYTSEFLRFRIGYEHRLSDLDEEDGRDSAFAELNVVFGAHPPEPFWVNR